MKTEEYTNLVNDIREYLKETAPFEYANTYETDAYANHDIGFNLRAAPWIIIAYLEDYDDTADLITRIKAFTI